jgi:hypothetical protein
LGLDADLQLVCGIPATNSSGLVFPSTPLSVKDLRTQMKAHFEKQPALPVMIENETFTFAIVGYGEDRENTNHFRFWVADPHVGKGVNRKEIPEVGLYTIEYDNEGRGVCTSFSESMRGKMFMGGVSFDSLYLGFQSQVWLVLFPRDAKR